MGITAEICLAAIISAYGTGIMTGAEALALLALFPGLAPWVMSAIIGILLIASLGIWAGLFGSVAATAINRL